MEFRKATQEDLEYVRQNPFEKAVKNYPFIEVSEESHAVTTIFEGEIVAVGGLLVHWEGVGELWLLLTDHCRKDGIYGVMALTAIWNTIKRLIKDNNIRRAQCTVRVDFPEAIKMVEAFGFEREGLMKEYTPDGCDVYRYARITKG